MMTYLISDAFAQEQSTAGVETAAVGMPPAPYELSPEKQMKDTVIFLVLLFAIFYFIIIRPQQKRLKSHRAMLSDLQKGDEIITGGGLVGRIHKFEGDHLVVVEFSENVRMKVARASISDKYREPSRPAAAKDKDAVIAVDAKATKKTANDN